jgi:hypothetical protein
MKFSVVVFCVVGDDDHPFAWHPAATLQVPEEFPVSLTVEATGLSAGNQPAVPQADSPKKSHAFPGGVMETNWIFHFRWYPHPAARTVLLKVNFIHRPQINVRISCQALKFFYAQRGIVRVLGAGRDRTVQFRDEASEGETPAAGTIAGNCEPKVPFSAPT